MKMKVFGIIAISVAAVSAAISASAALHATEKSSVSFDAVGPAGMKIHGQSKGPVQVADKGESFEFTSPTNAFVTGLDLRDTHLKKYLNVEKHPRASLVVPKAQVKVPAAGPVESTATGSLTLNGVTRPVKVTYKATASGKAYDVEAHFAVNLPDFAIEQPCYLGVCVQNTVKVAVALVARDD